MRSSDWSSDVCSSDLERKPESVKADRQGDEGGIGSVTLTDETPERDDDGRACAAQGLRGCEDEYIFTGMSIRRHCRGLPSCFHKPIFGPGYRPKQPCSFVIGSEEITISTP